MFTNIIPLEENMIWYICENKHAPIELTLELETDNLGQKHVAICPGCQTLYVSRVVHAESDSDISRAKG